VAECIAVINAGSSSIKFALFENKADLPLLFSGQIEQIGVAPLLTVKNSSGEQIVRDEPDPNETDHRVASSIILKTAIGLVGEKPISGVGHRVVHGGTRFTAPAVVTDDVIASLKNLCSLAPLHQPHNLVPIEAIHSAAPHIPQVACFDTAFHQSQPPIAQMIALPRELSQSGIRRYGFHGLSYEYVSCRLREVAPAYADKRIVIAHLGNGASLCGIHEGRSVATTMGFSALDGLVMGTRCGAIDPGALIYLLDQPGMDVRKLETLLYKQSGLLGTSGISSDMRALRASDDPRAREAIDLFVYRIIREIGSIAAALGGLDGLVFTGGIGQGDARTRNEVIAGCAWLGAELDQAANDAGETRIDATASRLPIWMLATDEERIIARNTAAICGHGAS
jgi:acetate kinase